MGALYIVLASFLGCAVFGVVSWCECNPPEKFNFRKYLGTLIRGLFVALALGAAYTNVPVGLHDILLAAFASSKIEQTAKDTYNAATKKRKSPPA